MAYLRKFSLPKPEKVGNKRVWHPIPRVSKVIPWGYTVEEDPKILIPIPEQLELMEEAIKMKKRYSYRELANWLTTVTGRPISHVGLIDRMKNEKRRKTKAQRQREIAKELAKALAQIEKLDSQLGGAGTRSGDDGTSDPDTGTIRDEEG